MAGLTTHERLGLARMRLATVKDGGGSISIAVHAARAAGMPWTTIGAILDKRPEDLKREYGSRTRNFYGG